MNDNQVLILERTLRDLANSTIELKSTHISWVILLDDFVYKIKKPLKLSFLDFSTIEKRKHFCERELVLNQRLTNDMYLNVLPICQSGSKIYIGTDDGEIIDYCLKMRRIDNSKEMRTMIESNRIQLSHIQGIAHQLAQFHSSTEVLKGVVSDQLLWDDFRDLSQMKQFVIEHIGDSAGDALTKMLEDIQSLLEKKAIRIKERDEFGYTRDCHGDLHSGNIFLLDDPIIFDCIEFNDHFRHIDVLNELAFLCMDLELYGRQDLSDAFLKEYLDRSPVIENAEDLELLLFYKLYRSNVKVKVNALKCLQLTSRKDLEDRLLLFKRYFELMMRYYRQLVK